MKVLHILAGGNVGGIETLCKDFVRYSKHENIILLLWGEGLMAEEMRKNGIEVIHLQASSKKAYSVIRQAQKICRRKGIEAVVVHHAAPLSHLCMHAVKRKYPNIKTIAYAHGNAADMYRKNDKKGLWIRKLILAWSLKTADDVIAISESVKNSLIHLLKTPEKKIHVIYNGVNVQAFDQAELRCFSNPVKMIYIGRLIAEKGVQITLDALKKLPDELGWSFQIVGDGPYRAALEKKVGELHLEEKVSFLGSRPDVPALLQQSDIFIHMPTCEEGFGIAVVEAMAAGLLCVCMAKGGIPEVISSGTDGILVRSEEELATVLKDLMSGTEKYPIMKLRQNAVVRSKNFGITQFTEKLDALLSGV